MKKIRSPICSVVGHVDHGKSTLLDFIRGTNIVNKEPGAITQSIGASLIPISRIREICKDLISKLKIDLEVPGLLFIDTPGHAAFTTLRKRGGSLADLAILVIDINEGVMEQTIESIQILKEFKTPFLIAANKVDLIPGFRIYNNLLNETLKRQNERVISEIDKKIYEIVGKLYEFGFNSERYDRIEDYTKQIAIVPISAKYGLGIPELLIVLIGLAQKYLKESLKLHLSDYGKGTILEIKDIPGFGKVIDAIIYDGTIRKGDYMIISGIEKPVVTKIRGLLLPKPLSEIRIGAKFESVNEVIASSGIRIIPTSCDNIIAGMPFFTSDKDEKIEALKKEVQKDVSNILIETEKDGLIIKADSLGSLEALVKLLKEKDIQVKSARIGNINKTDINEAYVLKEKNPFLGVILGFNVSLPNELKEEVDKYKIKIITNNVIYKIIEDYEEFCKSLRSKLQKIKLENLTSLCKIRLLPNYIFRQSNPAIVGIEVLKGTLKPNTIMMNSSGNPITRVKSIQDRGKNVNEAKKGEKVAVSLLNVTIGRTIKEDEVLYSYISEEEFKRYKEMKNILTPEQVELLKEITSIKRKNNPYWGF